MLFNCPHVDCVGVVMAYENNLNEVSYICSNAENTDASLRFIDLILKEGGEIND